MESDVIYKLSSIIEDSRYKTLCSILSNLINIRKHKVMTQQITNLYGSNNGKSSIHYNLDEFSKNILVEDYNRSNRIGFSTDEDWQRNILSFSEELQNRSHCFHLYYLKWNNRYFIGNCNASHRIAAIFRQSKYQSRPFELKLSGDEYFINKTSFDNLEKQYYCFLICFDNITKVSYFKMKMNDLIKRFSNKESDESLVYGSDVQLSIDTQYMYFFFKRNTWIELILLRYCNS